MELTEEQKKAALQAKQDAEAARVKSLIASAVATATSEAQAPMLKAVADLTVALSEATKANSAVAVKATNNMGTDPGRMAITGKEAKEGSGISAARVLKAQLVVALQNKGGINSDAVGDVLKGWGYSTEERMFRDARTKALAQNVFADGGAIVPVEYSSELVALLRNVTAVRKMGVRTIPMGASLEMPTAESAATAAYVGENAAITSSQQTLGTMRLTEKKLGALVVISNDLIRNAVIGAEEFVRDDLVQVLALKEDYTALFSPGSEYSPRGLTSLVLAANQYNQTAASHIAPTLAELRAILAKAVRTLMEANIPMVRMGWIFNPRTWAYLWAITDGNGNAVYQAEMAQGRIMGYPFIVTNQVPNNLTWSVDGSTDVSCIFFGDWSQFIIGESMGLQLEVFPNAAYDISGTVHSGISKDQSVIRAIQKHDFNVRYNRAFVIVKTRMGG
jgi:HK97 family phage major capsid protein